MPTIGTYFLNGTTWATGSADPATNIYTDSALSNAAPNGWYKDNNNIYRQVTGGDGTLNVSAACTSCGTAIALFSGASAFAACCGASSATYYIDSTETWDDATQIYSNPLLTTFPANQFYAYNDAGTKTSREKTGDATDGTDLGSETACSTCYPAVGLQFGSTAAVGCCTGATATYYMNQSTFAASTILYSTSDGGTAAVDGFYALISGSSSVYREVSGDAGALGTQTTCSDCTTSISLCVGTSASDVCCTGCPTNTAFTGTTNLTFNGSCSTSTIATNYWHNGSGTFPAADDTVFTNAGGTAVAPNGHIGISDGGTRKTIAISGGFGVAPDDPVTCI
tara:strand:+ start:494 stop:1507 length:1014 start_codon:yes stop_codon:yes gene_type:complete